MVGRILRNRDSGPLGGRGGDGDRERGARRCGRSLPAKGCAPKIRADNADAPRGRPSAAATADIIVPQAPLVPLEPNAVQRSRGSKYDGQRDLLRHVGLERKGRGGVEHDEEESFRAIVGRHHAARPPAHLLKKKSLVAAQHRHAADPASRPLRNAPPQAVRVETGAASSPLSCPDAAEFSGSESSPGPSPMRPVRPVGGHYPLAAAGSVLSRNMRKFDHAEGRRRLNTEERKARAGVVNAERAAAVVLAEQFEVLARVAFFATETRLRDALEASQDEDVRSVCEAMPCELHLKLVRLISSHRPANSSIHSSTRSPFRHLRGMSRDRTSVTSVAGSDVEDHGLSDCLNTSASSQMSTHEPVQHLSSTHSTNATERRHCPSPLTRFSPRTQPTYDPAHGASCASSIDLQSTNPATCHASCIAHKREGWKAVVKGRFAVEHEEFQARMAYVQAFHREMIVLECDASPSKFAMSPSFSPSVSPVPRRLAPQKEVVFNMQHDVQEDVPLSAGSSEEREESVVPGAPSPVPVPRLPTPTTSFGGVAAEGSATFSRKISTVGEQQDRVVLLERYMRERIIADERRALLAMHDVLREHA